LAVTAARFTSADRFVVADTIVAETSAGVIDVVVDSEVATVAAAAVVETTSTAASRLPANMTKPTPVEMRKK
jgi:hypothetical protein